ncbi:glycine receptor subunit alpha-2-like isoform X2 [Mya arenaria]|uniref:glycine receptor subunit alpha-2-like isoform X2 n=1 Tax=Mya arenaria TaxID=6604 RepID=UPI0022E17C5A|nr:glycine receptor subunit alpha-2-like isoform X2 [Mya arenaria]
MWTLLLPCFLAAATVTRAEQFETSTSKPPGSRQQVLDDLLKNYDPRILPNFEEDFPVSVLVQLHITNIDDISESNMEFSIGTFLRQTWNDSRLSYNALPNLKALELDTRMMEKVWVPDLFIVNEKKASVHMVTVPNKLMHVYPSGKVHYSVRITATLKCSMNLRKYPLDHQFCNIMMESYGYTTDNLVFEWNPIPLEIDRSLSLAQFDIGEIETRRCDKSYIGDTDGNTVNFTCIMMQFELIRNFGYYITQIYIPSILIVILSWVSFWLDIDAVPARISLGLLTVLTMTTQSAGARSSLPKVSYIKGIDVWMAVCMLFVFIALIEFAFVNVNTRVGKRHQQTKKMQTNLAKEADGEQEDNTPNEGRLNHWNVFASSRKNARIMDRFSRVAFPVAFIVFNIVYWSVYTFWQPSKSDVA